MNDRARLTDKIDRDAGVDMLRAAAIVMVVIYHLVQMSPQPLPGLMRLTRLGQYGVDLFFVLSGWLIGGLYWNERNRFGSVELKRFWLRRWLRTIPPYLAVMPVAWLAVWLARREMFNWGYLLFLQNYYREIPFYVVSWSLCIEEHFYLLMPLLLMWTLRFRAPPVNPLFLLLFGLAPVCRWWHSLNGLDPRFGLEWTATHLRMDGLLIGFWLAWVRSASPQMWVCLSRYAAAIAVVGLLGFISAELAGPIYVYRVGLTALAWLWAGLLLLMVADRCPRVAQSPWVKAVALSSYSVYLTHSLMIHVARLLMGKIPGLGWGAYFPLALLLVAVGGAVCYFGVERTTIRLRDRWVPRRVMFTTQGAA